MFKKIILILCLLFTQITPIQAINQQDTQSISEQVDTFIKSTNQSGADDTAALALAKHGVTGGGKTLAVGKNHALTATIVNSQMGHDMLVNAVDESVFYLQSAKDDSIYVKAGLRYYENEPYYSFRILKDQNSDVKDYITLKSNTSYNSLTGYDKSLEWMTGHLDVHMYVSKKSISDNEIIYNVKVIFYDRFDFRGNNESISKDIASLLGSALFKEFDWTSTIEFEVIGVNPCPHQTENFSFSYDSTTESMLSHEGDEYAKNETEKITFDRESGPAKYYLLDKKIRLSHDKPWEFEYRVNNPQSIPLSFDYAQSSKTSYFMHYRTHSIWFPITRDGVKHYYGILARTYFNYNTKDIYRFTLKNVLEEEGNMIYVSIFNETKNKLELDFTPMDDYYLIIDGNWVYQDDNDRSLSGEDFEINYIGNKSFPFQQDFYELKIWENGRDNDNASYLTNQTTNASCTSNGYTTHTCAMCGYSYKSNITNKLEHSYGDWKIVTNPTCTSTGLKRQTCNVCKTNNEQVINKLEHNVIVDNAVNATCTSSGLTEGSHCDRCNTILTKQETVSALGHSFGNWYTASNPTCSSQGLSKRDCLNCEHYETNAIPSLGHYVITQNVVETTCSSTGLTEGSYCGRCNEVLVKQETIEQLEHSYTSEFIEPTCTSYGYTHHTCNGCFQEFNDSYVDMVEHTYTHYVSDNNATYEADGTKTAKCDNCDSTHTVIDEGTQLKQMTITSSTYKIDDQYIYIPLGTNITTLKNNLINKEHIEVSKVGTGAKINMIVNGVVVDSKEIVISGDTNGDGKITITDMIALKAHILKKNTLEGVYALAGDMNSDSKISITDFIQAKAHILKN